MSGVGVRVRVRVRVRVAHLPGAVDLHVDIVILGQVTWRFGSMIRVMFEAGRRVAPHLPENVDILTDVVLLSQVEQLPDLGSALGPPQTRLTLVRQARHLRLACSGRAPNQPVHDEHLEVITPMQPWTYATWDGTVASAPVSSSARCGRAVATRAGHAQHAQDDTSRSTAARMLSCFCHAAGHRVRGPVSAVPSPRLTMIRLSTLRSWLTMQPRTDLRRRSPLRRPNPRKHVSPGFISSDTRPGTSTPCRWQEPFHPTVGPSEFSWSCKSPEAEKACVGRWPWRSVKNDYVDFATLCARVRQPCLRGRPRFSSTESIRLITVSVASRQADGACCQDDAGCPHLLHGEALLVLPAGDLEHVALELLHVRQAHALGAQSLLVKITCTAYGSAMMIGLTRPLALHPSVQEHPVAAAQQFDSRLMPCIGE